MSQERVHPHQDLRAHVGESIVRFNIFGASKWLPLNRIGGNVFAHAFMESNRPINWSKPLPASAYLSLFPGNFSVADRLASVGSPIRKQIKDYLKLFNQTKSCFASQLTFIGDQFNCIEGIVGFGGIDNRTNKKALLLFGTNKNIDLETIVPECFLSLLNEKPVAGDYGDEQFISSWLWHTK